MQSGEPRIFKAVKRLAKKSGQGQNRTADTRIFSPLLYRLSYLARSLEYSLKVGGSQDRARVCGVCVKRVCYS